MTGDARSAARDGDDAPVASADVVHFGEFTFCRSSGELVGPRGATRLARQVAEVLQLLLAHPGDVVQRTEFHERLWPDTTVEFDQGLNFCIRQLRMALSDDAGEPRYIETLPRRGYRLIAPLGVTDAPAPTPAATAHSRDVNRPRAVARMGVLIVAAIIALVFGARGVLRRGSANSGALAILAFDVADSDAALAPYRATLAEQLVTDLTQQGGASLSVMGPSFTSRFPGMRTPPESLQAALSASYVLSGALRSTSAGTRVFAQLIRLRDRKHVFASVQFDSGGSPARMSAIADSIARGVRRVIAGAPGGR